MSWESFADTTLHAWASLDFSGLIIPLFTYTLLLALYAAFVWHFFKSISKRDLFNLNHGTDHKWTTSFAYVVKYVISFPVLTFLWFAGLSLILFLISKSQTTENILLISMALVAAARVTSYYKEGIAEEISKMLPLGVLAIFIVDPTYFSLAITMTKLYSVSNNVPLLINYLFFTFVLELFLRVLFLMKRAVIDGMGSEKPEKRSKETIRKQKK